MSRRFGYGLSPHERERQKESAKTRRKMLKHEAKLHPFPENGTPIQKAAHEAGGTLIQLGFDRGKLNRHLEMYAPGCGSPTHVVGTNGGTMPCGARLTSFGKTEQYFCGHCQERLGEHSS